MNRNAAKFNAVKSVFGSPRDLGQYGRDFIAGQFYQALMRSKLRDLNQDEDTQIDIIVYSAYEKAIIDKIISPPKA